MLQNQLNSVQIGVAINLFVDEEETGVGKVEDGEIGKTGV